MKKFQNFLRKIFKIRKPSENLPTYVEKDTICDKCPNLNKCIEEGNVLDNTLSWDTRRHYIRGMGDYECVLYPNNVGNIFRMVEKEMEEENECN